MWNPSRRTAMSFGLTAAALAAPQYGAAQSAGTGSAEQRLRERAIELPRVAPVAGVNNVPYVRTGNLIFLSGLGPSRPEGGLATGKVGREVSAEDAYGHARLTGLALLAVLRGAVGSLDTVNRVVKVLGMVNATPEFADHPKVINGCSDLFVEVFGEDRGRHARSAVGMASLPFNITVEIEAVFEVA
ncbi:RidA family protein [Belnapia sp. F-4-1]|uniref:RidA family protein n=1 Tax=Belnapia sp. F-4-1 TaxID=1545443 RepID=UPI00350F2EC4